MDAGTLDRKITILHRVEARDPNRNTPVGKWVPFAIDVPANVQDYLPSRGERVAAGVQLALKPSRIRIRWRAGVDSSMRVEYRGRALDIVAGPAELGRREGLEFIAQDPSTQGDAP